MLLYYRGAIKENTQSVGIVGSRRTTEYGKNIALELGEYLGQNNITVISGLAKGIDGYAHTGALKGSGYTLAFLGCGVDICYPSEHRGLMDKIIQNGAVISKYPPNTKAKTQHFPQRNGLIASWSNSVVVVEATEKSGSLITAQIAKSIGRLIFAVPHNINTKSGVGTNQLILDGATPYLNTKQLKGRSEEDEALDLFLGKEYIIDQKNKEESMQEAIVLNPIEQKIVNFLGSGEKTILRLWRLYPLWSWKTK